MSTINPTYGDIAVAAGSVGPIAKTVAWGPMANGDVGQPIPASLAPYAERTFQVAGTFGVGGTVAIEGTNDGVNYAALKDVNGSSVSITSAGIVEVSAPVIGIRPHVTGGDGSTALTVTACIRRVNR